MGATIRGSVTIVDVITPRRTVASRAALDDSLVSSIAVRRITAPRPGPRA